MGERGIWVSLSFYTVAVVVVEYDLCIACRHFAERDIVEGRYSFLV